MKTIDIIKQLQAELPKLTNDFTQSTAITSAILSGTDLTIEPFITGMNVGSFVTIKGLQQLNLISGFSTIDEVTTITTTYKHDLTQGYSNSVTILNGVTETEYDVVEVISNTEFSISTTGTPDFTNQSLIESLAGFNNQFEVTAVTANDFTINTGRTTSLAFYTANAFTEYGYRIYGLGFADMINRYIESNTTISSGSKVPTTSVNPTIWVSMLNENSSQKRRTYDDGENTTQQGEESRILEIKNFEILLTYPVNDRLGFDGMNYAENLKLLLNRCLYGLQLPNYNNTDSKYLLMPLSNTPILTDGAIYQHQFIYQGASEIQNNIDDPDENDGVNDPTFGFKDFEVQYRLEFDDFEETKKTDGFSVK